MFPFWISFWVQYSLLLLYKILEKLVTSIQIDKYKTKYYNCTLKIKKFPFCWNDVNKTTGCHLCKKWWSNLCDYFVSIHGHHKIRGIRDASVPIITTCWSRQYGFNLVQTALAGIWTQDLPLQTVFKKSTTNVDALDRSANDPVLPWIWLFSSKISIM